MLNTRKVLKQYLINKLESFGCPDSFLEPTAKRMLIDITKILKKNGIEI